MYNTKNETVTHGSRTYEFSFDREQVKFLSRGINFLLTHAMSSASQIGIQGSECEPLGDVLQFKRDLDEKIIEMAEREI
ncbi:MAG: hypothetical protein M0R02_09240 [Bacteroidales bacterium]|nr:hypothetical protein [Bacteroidales bacterium]